MNELELIENLLVSVNRKIADVADQVEQQQKIVRTLDRNGPDSAAALDALADLEKSLHLHLAERNQLLVERIKAIRK